MIYYIEKKLCTVHPLGTPSSIILWNTFKSDVYVVYIVVCPVLLYFLLAIALSVLLRSTDFDYPFGIFKLFFNNSINISKTNISQYLIVYLTELQKSLTWIRDVYDCVDQSIMTFSYSVVTCKNSLKDTNSVVMEASKIITRGPC